MPALLRRQAGRREAPDEHQPLGQGGGGMLFEFGAGLIPEWAEVRARQPLWLPNPQSLLHEAVLGRSHREHGILRAAALPGRYHDLLQVQQEQTGCLGAGQARERGEPVGDLLPCQPIELP